MFLRCGSICAPVRSWTFGYQAIICFKKNNFGRLRKVTSADIAEGFRFHGVKMAHTGHIDPGESPDQSLVMSFYGSVRPFFRFFDAQHGFALHSPTAPLFQSRMRLQSIWHEFCTESGSYGPR